MILLKSQFESSIESDRDNTKTVIRRKTDGRVRGILKFWRWYLLWNKIEVKKTLKIESIVNRRVFLIKFDARDLQMETNIFCISWWFVISPHVSKNNCCFHQYDWCYYGIFSKLIEKECTPLHFVGNCIAGRFQKLFPDLCNILKTLAT